MVDVTGEVAEFGSYLEAVEAFLDQPGQKPSHGHERTIHGRRGLSLVPSQVVTEVAHVPGRHSTDAEGFPIGLSEPVGKLSKVLSECSPGVRREVVAVEEAFNEVGFAVAERLRVKNIIT